MRDHIDPGIYRIVNVQSGTVLDLSGADNRTVSGWSEHGSTNQLVRYSDPLLLWLLTRRFAVEGQPPEWQRKPHDHVYS